MGGGVILLSSILLAFWIALLGIATALTLASILPFAGELSGAMPTFVAAGLMIALGFLIVTCVYNYARLSVIKVNVSLRERKSTIDRPPAENSPIYEGEQVEVLKLQEFLFFRHAEQVISRYWSTAAAPRHSPNV